MRILPALMGVMAVLPPSAGLAQTGPDVVVMRRSIAPPNPRPSVPKVTPGAKRRCDMPPAQTTIVNYGSYFDMGDAPSIAGAHAICETFAADPGICYIFDRGGAGKAFVARYFSSGTIVTLSGTSSSFSGAGRCSAL